MRESRNIVIDGEKLDRRVDRVIGTTRGAIFFLISLTVSVGLLATVVILVGRLLLWAIGF